MVVVILALLGGVIGGVLFSGFDGFALGLIVGAVAGWVANLAGRVRQLSDDDLASIYAFLQARPTPPPVKDIPLLAP